MPTLLSALIETIPSHQHTPMNETAHQNLHCDTQLNFTFGVIILTLLIALMAVSVSIRTSAERKYHKVAAMFVHNMCDPVHRATVQVTGTCPQRNGQCHR
ncbi:hypothetical protein [Aeromonas sp. R2-1]|uniref:hypothetical protein n=1 Tax=Aeromonas sp. R2-1 TaxID=3138459 RepID=UPI0034A3AE13